MHLGRCNALYGSNTGGVGLPVQQVPKHVKRMVERAKTAGLKPARSLGGGRWEGYRQKLCLPPASRTEQHSSAQGQKKKLGVHKAGELGVSFSGALVQEKRAIERISLHGRGFRANSVVAASIPSPSFSPSMLSGGQKAVRAPSGAFESEVAAAYEVVATAESDAPAVHAASEMFFEAQAADSPSRLLVGQEAIHATSVLETQVAAAHEVVAPAECDASAAHATSSLSSEARTAAACEMVASSKGVAQVRPKSRRQKDGGAFLSHKDVLDLVKVVNIELERKFQAKNLKQMIVAQLDKFLDAHEKGNTPNGLTAVASVVDGQARMSQGVARDPQHASSGISACEALRMRQEVHKHRILSLQQKAARMAEHSTTLLLLKIRDLLRLKKYFEGLGSTEMVGWMESQLEELHRGLPQVGLPAAKL
jgi:hypothetical protein